MALTLWRFFAKFCKSGFSVASSQLLLKLRVVGSKIKNKYELVQLQMHIHINWCLAIALTLILLMKIHIGNWSCP